MDLGRRHVPYHEAWDLQRTVHAEVVAGTRTDTVLLVEHESVYTAGRRTSAADRPVDGTPVVDVDRGGRITWHGPGQLVAYPIVRLAEPVDVVAYVRALEQAVIDAAAALGLATVREEGRSRTPRNDHHDLPVSRKYIVVSRAGFCSLKTPKDSHSPGWLIASCRAN